MSSDRVHSNHVVDSLDNFHLAHTHEIVNLERWCLINDNDNDQVINDYPVLDSGFPSYYMLPVGDYGICLYVGMSPTV